MPLRIDWTAMSLLVEGLEVELLARRRFEVGAAVRFDRHRAQHRPGIGLLGDADPRLVGRRRGLGQHLDHAQRRDPRALGPGEIAVVDVHDGDRGRRNRVGLRCEPVRSDTSGREGRVASAAAAVESG